MHKIHFNLLIRSTVSTVKKYVSTIQPISMIDIKVLEIKIIFLNYENHYIKTNWHQCFLWWVMFLSDVTISNKIPCRAESCEALIQMLVSALTWWPSRPPRGQRWRGHVCIWLGYLVCSLGQQSGTWLQCGIGLGQG